MNIFITGSNGFVGSRLMYFLENKGHSVYGIDNSVVCTITPHPNTELGDIRNIEDYAPFMRMTFDLIIHCAASKHDFGISEEEYFSNNKYGTEVLIQFAEALGIKQIIYYSTVSVYGHQNKSCDETADYLSNTVYGDSKLAGERVINIWQQKDPLNHSVVTLRPSVIFGPHNFANMYNLINQMYKFPWFMVGKGDHIKSMISLENIVDLTYFVMDKMTPGVQNFNCIDKPYLTVWELMKIITANQGFKLPKLKIPFKCAVAIGKFFDIIGKITKKDLPINSDRMIKFATPTDYRAEKIRELGYVQKYSIENELNRTCEWYLKLQKAKKRS
ncbi:MAG: hypothetical protein APR54_02580 [Candidatus Cloacimonas sp. SDB]|nr:MAG: hypothetical protein APR54_02580 [Candidatus Cloacimonas sp. SDB]